MNVVKQKLFMTRFDLSEMSKRHILLGFPEEIYKM